ncbi:MAG: hypothetical protein M3Y69_10140 [Verrucomicrobiota bacterium]|nr:hypothetical protein [Verrucomicrobiota bacterium]
MRTPAIAEAEFTPLFDWSPPRRRKLSIVSFIAASVALHALCFYLFQVIYPPTVALLPPPARVTVITPDSDEGRVLLRWIEAEDPALLSTTQRPPDAATVRMPDAVHIPSYTGHIPELRMPSLVSTVPSIPSAQPPGPVPIARAATPLKTTVVPTTLQFGVEAEALGSPTLPPLGFTASRREPPAPAEFRLAIGEDGEVRHCFLKSSSGDPALDRQARHVVVLTRFPTARAAARNAEAQLVWTTATVAWGNDIALPAPPPAAISTP